jgi:hypothetical protein
MIAEKTVMWPHDLAECAVRQGFITDKSTIITSGPALSIAQVEAVERAVESLFQTLLHIIETEYDGCMYEAGAALGFPRDEIDVLQWGGAGLSTDVLTRVDVVETKLGLKIVEFNIGSSVGGMVNASLPILLNLSKVPSALDAWSGYICDRVEPGSCGALVEDAQHISSMSVVLNQMSQYLQNKRKGSVVVCSQNELAWNGNRLTYKGQMLDWVYPLLSPELVKRDPASYDALRSALQSGAVYLPVGQASRILGSKLALALLHDFAAFEAASDEQRALIRGWLPRTVRLSEQQIPDALERQQSLILKPATGYGGNGVIIGREMSLEAWRAALLRSLGSNGVPCILQDYHEPLERRVSTSHATDGPRSFMARCVYGVFVIEGRTAIPPLVRAAPVDRSAVINFATGGAAGCLPFCNA